MDRTVNKDSGAGEGKGKQNVLLIVLLVLVGASAYVYFFTDLIKPGKSSSGSQQVAKKPLPPAEGTPVKPEAADAAKAGGAPAAKPEPAPAAPAPAPAAEVRQPEQSQPADAVKKALPGAEKAAAKKPVPPEKKEPAPAPAPAPKASPAPAPAPAATATAPAKAPAPAKAADVKKPAAAAAAKAGAEDKKPAAKKETFPRIAGSGPWSVLVGNYVLEEDLANDLARVRKAGFEAGVAAGGPKKTHMTRLLLADFTDRDSAVAELAKLKKHTADAFIADQAGLHSVYAGSYRLDDRAASESERLAAAGFKLTLKQVEVSLPTKNLVAGPFSERSAAEAALKKLRADVKPGGTR